MKLDQAINAVQNVSNDSYVNQIPKGVVEAAAKSFVCSFAFSTLFSGGNVLVGAAGGILGSLMSITEAVSRPIFTKLFNNSTNGMNLINLVLKNVILVTCVGMIAQPILSVTLSMNMDINLVRAVVSDTFWDIVFNSNARNDSAYSYFWLIIR